MASSLRAAGPVRPLPGAVGRHARICPRDFSAPGSQPGRTKEGFCAAASDEPSCRAHPCPHRVSWGDREIALTPRGNLRRVRGENAGVWIDEVQIYRRHASSGGRGSALTLGLPQSSLNSFLAKTDPPAFRVSEKPLRLFPEELCSE